MDQNILSKFFTKYTIIASSIAYIFGIYMKEFIGNIVNALIDPLFSIDLNNDGKPDLKQLNEYSITLWSRKFPLGFIMTEIVKLILAIIILIIIINIIVKYTNLVPV